MEIYNENEETVVKRLLETMTPYIINKKYIFISKRSSSHPLIHLHIPYQCYGNILTKKGLNSNVILRENYKYPKCRTYIYWEI